MIGGIRLKNWRSHSESELKFDEGTNVLVGIAGSGKSSVLDGVSFGLFGTFPALWGRKIKLDDLIRSGEKRAEVTVDFLGDYSVRRVVEKGRGTTTSELRKNGKLIEGVKSEAVTRKIVELLKINYELFERAVYSEQNQIDYFLRIPRGQRKSKIDQLLGIDQFEAARKNCTRLAKSLGDTAEQYERLFKDFEGIEKEKVEVEKGARGLEGELKKRKELLEGSEREKLEAGRSLEGAEKASHRFTELRASLGGLEERKGELGKKAGGKPGMSKGELENQIRKIEQEAGKRHKLLGIYESGIEEGRKRVAERGKLERELVVFQERDLKKELSAEENEHEARGKEFRKMEARREFLERGTIGLRGDSCPLCKREWSPELRVRVKTDSVSELEAVKAAAGKIGAELPGLEKKVSGLRKEYDEHAAAVKRLEEIGNPEKEILKLGGLAEGILEKDRRDGKELEGLRAGLEALKAAGELEGVEKRIGEVEKEIVGLKFDEKGYASLKRKYDSILEKWSKANSEVASVETSLENLRAEKRRIAEREREVGDFRKKVEKMRKGEELLTKFKNSLVDVQEELRREFVKNLNGTMSELWDGIYPYGDFTDARLGVVDGDYVLQLKRGEWVDVEGVVSGGERSTAALVLRIGFALALAPHLKILILDEPTHNLDSRGIRELGNVLRERIGDYVSQVFLITHDENLEHAVSGSLYRLDRDKGKNEATKLTLVD